MFYKSSNGLHAIGLERHHLRNRLWVKVLKVGLYGYYYNMVLTILKANKRVCHFKGIFKYVCLLFNKKPNHMKTNLEKL